MFFCSISAFSSLESSHVNISGSAHYNWKPNSLKMAILSLTSAPNPAWALCVNGSEEALSQVTFLIISMLESSVTGQGLCGKAV